MTLESVLHEVTKPARYTGGEWNSIIKDWSAAVLKVALAYPDVYEIGMSNLAIPIIYGLFNGEPDCLCERVFAPWKDMEAEMRSHDIPLFSLETRHPLRNFDVIGFSLGYELTFTNVLNMLDLAHIPVFAAERDSSFPLIIAGGTSALNPEPLSDFIDFFVIGEGEEVVSELATCLREWKKSGAPKDSLLREAARIPGIYVPSLYKVGYNPDGIINSFEPTVPEARLVIERRFAPHLPMPVTHSVVPYIEVVHDRGIIEIQRGCSRGCRFCQAGCIYRPVRERSKDEVLQAVSNIINNCGFDEISLLSLSTSDYPHIDELVSEILKTYKEYNLTLSLPSIRMDSHSIKLVDTLPHPRGTGLTFAPEAGSDRLRRVINKGITEAQILEAAGTAFERGWKGLKLYFMVGLPTETEEDVRDIIKLIEKINEVGKSSVGKRPQLRVSVSTFIPKPHTPFQWCAQASESELLAKQEILMRGLQKKSVKLSWQSPRTSLLEAVLSRGDRRIGKVIYRAWKAGSTFDAWSDFFSFDNWMNAMKGEGLDPAFYACRQRSLDEILPWSHIDPGIYPEFLKREYQKALAALETPDCRFNTCQACGLQKRYTVCKARDKA